ncbi:peptidase S1C family [Halomonadaceae bacterium LMG 33818]|uniref:S1C family serine protease n=1 Tax=Cernens ardua TaxID=3402176 RepID=UPI003EDC37FD
MRKLLGGILWPVLCGILLAVVVLQYLPQFIGRKAAAPAHSSEQSVVKRDSYADAVARAAPAVVTVSSLRTLSGQAPKSPLNNDPIYQPSRNDNNGENDQNQLAPTQPMSHQVINQQPGNVPVPVAQLNNDQANTNPTTDNEKSSRQAILSPSTQDEGTNRSNGTEGTEPGSEQLINLGSGVIVSHSGYILTNNHVIRSADQIVVTLADGRMTDAKLVGSDNETDLAVLKINLSHLPTVKFADNYEVRPGDIAMAIGNPFNIGQSVTMGIVSAVGRARFGVSPYEDFIQTDASINPGNSGGALIDADGRLIGINTAIFSRTVGSQGIGFAIPIHIARRVLDMIIRYGHVERGYLGIDATQRSNLSLPLASIQAPNYLVVGSVAGPAEQAGVKQGDVILAINGVPLLNPYAALNEIANLQPGSIITMTLLRGHEHIQVNIRVGVRPPNLTSITPTPVLTNKQGTGEAQSTGQETSNQPQGSSELQQPSFEQQSDPSVNGSDNSAGNTQSYPGLPN